MRLELGQQPFPTPNVFAPELTIPPPRISLPATALCPDFINRPRLAANSWPLSL